MDGYNLITQSKICSTHGGLAIYLNNKLNYKHLNLYFMSLNVGKKKTHNKRKRLLSNSQAIALRYH